MSCTKVCVGKRSICRQACRGMRSLLEDACVASAIMSLLRAFLEVAIGEALRLAGFFLHHLHQILEGSDGRCRSRSSTFAAGCGDLDFVNVLTQRTIPSWRVSDFGCTHCMS